MIYNNVKLLAEKKSMSIGALEKAAGLSNGSICKWRKCSPTIEKLIVVANVLGVTVDELVRVDTQGA